MVRELYRDENGENGGGHKCAWYRDSGRLSMLALFVLALQVLPVLCLPAGAQVNRISRSYITPFPEGDKYQLYVLGDSIGDGIFLGLQRGFNRDRNIALTRQSRVSTGLSRTRRFNWLDVLDKLLNVNKVHIAVVMLGANDNKHFRVKGRIVKFRTPEWRKIYGERVDRFMKRLRKAGVAVYWVGLPIMRDGKFNRDMEYINEILREKAFQNDIRFIETFNGFTDQFNRYSDYGPDLSGRIRRLRARDGIHFTMSGYRKLAQYAELAIRRDLSAARSERDIPLAGGEEEHNQATDQLAARSDEDDGASQKKAKQTKAKKTKTGKKRRLSRKQRRLARLEKKRAAQEEAQKKAEQQRRERLKGLNPLLGEMIASDLSDELTAIATISSANNLTPKEAQQQMPLQQRPWYKVLEMGENLQPKRGRTDDFSWPPPG